MVTLGEMKQAGFRLTIHCEGRIGGPVCTHFAEPGMDQLIQYFGVDFDIYALRGAFLSRFRCERCGSFNATIRLRPGDDTPGLMAGAGGAHHHGRMPSVEERARRAAAFEAEFRARGGRTNAEIAQEARARLRAQRLAEKGKGPAFIGPPNPWAHRKRGRWL